MINSDHCIIFVKNYSVMVSKVFLVLGIILLIVGNILSYVYNGRLLHPMTNVCLSIMVFLNFFNFKHGKGRNG